jgi:hypothetical protein
MCFGSPIGSLCVDTLPINPHAVGPAPGTGFDVVHEARAKTSLTLGPGVSWYNPTGLLPSGRDHALPEEY